MRSIAPRSLNALGRFGSQASLPALTGIVTGSKPVALKVAACDAIAGILKCTTAPASADLVAALKAAVAGSDQNLRRAAAEALSVSGLKPADRLMLVQTEALAK